MNTHEKTAYVDNMLESTITVLGDPIISEELGQRTQTLSESIARIVPILSPGDSERMSKILTPDDIPMLMIEPEDKYHYETSMGEFSTAQIQSALETIARWNPNKATPIDILAAISKSGRNLGEGKTIVHEYIENSTAAVYLDNMMLSSEQLRKYYSTTNGPRGRLGQVLFRPMLLSFIHAEDTNPDPAVLLHELTHVQQDEASPINFYSSQAEINEQSLRYELEAYFVGATILGASIDKTLLGKEVNLEDIDPQLLVESARLLSPEYDPRDPFKPNPSLLKLLNYLGVDKSHISDESNLDFDEVIESMGISTSNPKITSKNKKKGRFTPPKNKI
jgi:hypothetical protein